MTALGINLGYRRILKPLKRPLRRLWKRYLKWPAPLWRLEGYAELNWAGYRFKFRAVNQTIWWLRRVYEGKYEKGVRVFLTNILKPGDIFFDVGAWTGPYSLLASKLVHPRGRVYSFEPDPVARSLMKWNLAANGITNVIVFPYGVTDREGSAWLDSHRIGASESRVTQSGGIAEIQTVSLTGFCAKHAVHPHVIKIDVEGSEAKVFAGALEEIQQSRATVVEIHEEKLREMGADPAAFLQSLFDSGKQIIALHQKDGEGAKPGAEVRREHAAALTGVFLLGLVQRSS